METFAEFNERVGSHKTGYYGFDIDMYTKRNGNRDRVFRVMWPERNSKYPTHDDYKKALRKQRSASANGFYCPAGNEWVWQNQLFPYTENGLKAAISFSDSVEPKREAFYSRDRD